MLQILIVEDDIILAKRMIAQLNSLGYTQIDFVETGEEAVAKVKNRVLDIVFMDIELPGALNGIQTTEIINKIQKKVAIVYLSGMTGKTIFESMKRTEHLYYLPKPFNLFQLKSVLEYLLVQQEKESYEVIPILNESVFLKKKDQFDRIPLTQILWVEGGRNNITVQTQHSGKYVIAGTFSPFIKRINKPLFIRVHRSFLINLKHVDAVRGHQFIIGTTAIPFSKNYVPDLNQLLHLIKSSK